MERDVLIRQLILHEGVRLTVYEDSLGVSTIGVGRNLRDKGISREEALYLLNHDIDECVTDLASFPWFVTLDTVRQRVLIDLRFNLGPTRFRGFKIMLRAMAEQDYPAAAKSLYQSLWYRQVGSRAVRLVQMMREGRDVTVWPHEETRLV